MRLRFVRFQCQSQRARTDEYARDEPWLQRGSDRACGGRSDVIPSQAGKRLLVGGGREHAVDGVWTSLPPPPPPP